jgi:glycosyltransferase involved in cell wall biosynthesis
MKILWISHRDSQHPGSGGAEKTIHQISTRLGILGHEIEVLTTSWRGAPRVYREAGVRVVRYPTALGPHVVLPAVLLRRAGFDVVIDDLAHVVPWCSPWLGAHSGVVYFRHLHRRTLQGQVARPLAESLTLIERTYSSIYRDWPFVTESTDAIADLVELGVDKNRIRCIPPGVDLSMFKPRTKSAQPHLVYFGGLKAYKRPLAAVMVLEAVINSGIDARMSVIGIGPQLDLFRARAREAGVLNRVAFLGRIDEATLAAVVGTAWVNLHFSVSEGWCLSAMEAAASGVPTVAFSVPGLRDSVQHGVSGLLAPEGDVDRLITSVKSIIQNPKPWSSACTGWASHFGWDRAAKRWEELLEETR